MRVFDKSSDNPCAEPSTANPFLSLVSLTSLLLNSSLQPFVLLAPHVQGSSEAGDERPARVGREPLEDLVAAGWIEVVELDAAGSVRVSVFDEPSDSA